MLLKKYRNENYKKTDEWNRKVSDFNRRMTVNAYDIRTKDKLYQKRLETIYGVKMCDEDEESYLNNCYGSYLAHLKHLLCGRNKRNERKKEREESGQRKRTEMVRQAEE